MSFALSQSEINERVEILRRFREALVRQRERFREYLAMLEEQEQLQARGDEADRPEDRLEMHVRVEQEIVREIGTFQQVIEPLELMYREYDPSGAEDLPRLRTSLDRAKEEILHRAAYTRELLQQQLESLRSEIAGLRIMHASRTTYLTPAPTAVDISA